MRYDDGAGEDRTLQDIEKTIFHFPLFFLSPKRKAGAKAQAFAPVFCFISHLSTVFYTPVENFFILLRTG